MKCVLLFDIDGTLVMRSDARPSAGQRAMNQAAKEMTGVDGLANRIEFAGATDLGVAGKLLEMGGVAPTDGGRVTLLEKYTRHMFAYISDDSYLPLGDPHRVLPELKRRGAVVGLATGNVKEGARAKLESAGIAAHFDLALGGYGDDAEVRADIVRTAMVRCDPEGVLPAVVIGDTPLDVTAALAADALCIGVPAGRYTSGDLLDAGAHGVVGAVNEELVIAIGKLVDGSNV